VLVGSNAKEVLQERTLERSIAALAILEPAILEAALGGSPAPFLLLSTKGTNPCL
jgi:hypothetical protein